MHENDEGPHQNLSTVGVRGNTSPAPVGEATAEQLRKIVEAVLDTRLAAIEDRLRVGAPVSGQVRPMITERELAQLLRCDPRTVRRLEVSGELPPALRIGGSKRWQRQVIEDWLDQIQRERAG